MEVTGDLGLVYTAEETLWHGEVPAADASARYTGDVSVLLDV